MNKTYTVIQVANILGYSTNSIYTFLKEGRIVGIRVGKGRYRVSQEELNKLLHLKKSEEIQPISVKSSAPTSIQPVFTTSETEEIPSLDKHLEETKDNIPSLFDWFVSLTTIIVGFTIILFIRSFEGFSNIGLSQFLVPIKINLLVAGIGLFSVNVINRTRKNWYFIFNLITFLNLLAFSLMLLLSKDFFGFAIFALLLLVMFFHLILNLKGIISFVIYTGLLTIILPVTLILNPPTNNLPVMSFFSTWSPIQASIAWLIVACTINGIIWIGQSKHKFLFWINFLIFSVGLVYFAYFYSAQLYWSRALIFVLILLSIIISFFWHKLDLKDEEVRKTIVSIFGDLLLVFLAIVTIIWIAQNNISTYAQHELTNKIVYGESLFQSIIDSSKQNIINYSGDQSLIEAVKKKDSSTLNKLSKTVFNYSLNFRRLLVTDEKGNVLSVYPETTIPYTDISFEEYYRQVKTIKDIYVSNLFETTVNGIKTQEIVIANPIIDEEENLVGVLIGSLDINSLNNKLQQYANSNEKEYFLVLDAEGKIIINPENISGLKNEEIQDLIANQTDNKDSIEQVINFDNKTLQINGQINDANWILVLRRPLVDIYNFNNITNLLLNLIIVSVGFIVILWNMAHLKKRI